MTICTIELKNSDVATYEDVTYTAKGNRHSPVPPLLRRLIADGRILPDDIVQIRRGAVLCFKPCLACRWAALDIVDDPRDGLVRQPAYIGPHCGSSPSLTSLGHAGGVSGTNVPPYSPTLELQARVGPARKAGAYARGFCARRGRAA